MVGTGIGGSTVQGLANQWQHGRPQRHQAFGGGLPALLVAEGREQVAGQPQLAHRANGRQGRLGHAGFAAGQAVVNQLGLGFGREEGQQGQGRAVGGRGRVVQQLLQTQVGRFVQGLGFEAAPQGALAGRHVGAGQQLGHGRRGGAGSR